MTVSALATLEIIHYLRNGAPPFNRYLIRIDIPNAVRDGGGSTNFG